MSDEIEIENRAEAALRAFDDIHLAVIKTHIIVHQWMNEIIWIRLGGKPTNRFRYLNFMQSVELALIGHYKPDLRDRLGLLDIARNELSHSWNADTFLVKLLKFMRASEGADTYELPAAWPARLSSVQDTTNRLLFEVAAVMATTRPNGGT